MTDLNHVTYTVTETETGYYQHLRSRDMLAELAKADKRSARDLRRGAAGIMAGPRGAAPVMPGWRSNREKHADNLLDRTICWIDAKLHAGESVTVHLFRPGPKARQCQRFNKELDARYRYRDGVRFEYVDPADWGFHK